MSDINQASETLENGDGAGALPNLPIVIHAQYLKDLSFENPRSPQSLRKGQPAPQMDLNIGMDARRLEDPDIEYLYEVILTLNVTAMREDGPVYIAELVYGAAVSLNDIEESRHHMLLLTEVPRLIFPFARQVLGHITQSGGYPALLLTPMDFQAMYMQELRRRQEPDTANTTNVAQS